MGYFSNFSWYRLIKPLLFSMPPEMAHTLTLGCLKTVMPPWLAARRREPYIHKPVQLMGKLFPNPIGIAAGLDKNGDYIDALFGLGVGFIEVGAVTPRPQPGNTKPRLLRVPQANALINSMGFNNLGVEYLENRLQRRRLPGIVGVNLGKNRDTPLSEALHDYLYSMRRLFPLVDFMTVNLSSPNTPQLRLLQQKPYLLELLRSLKGEQLSLAATQGRQVPLLLKLDVDIAPETLQELVESSLAIGIDGIITTNTTTDHGAVMPYLSQPMQGGLSGAPLFPRLLEMVKAITLITGGHLPLIAVGGIQSAQDAHKVLAAGAHLIQLYSGLVYRGPSLVHEIYQGLHR